MSYFIEKAYGGRIDVEFDSPRFLADLAGALGGVDVDPSYQGGRFRIGELTIYLRAGYGAKARRVTVNCGTADSEAHRLAYARGKVPTFPSITIDPDRPLDTIVKDIKRRLIEPAAEPLAALKDLAAAQAETASELKSRADSLNAKFPGVVTLSDDPTKREAPFYLNRGGIYLSGRLNSDGALYVDRLGTVPATKLEALIALLSE